MSCRSTAWSSAFAMVMLTALVAGCAHTGPRSPSAKPVIYSNETYNQLGPAKVQAQAEACEDDNAVGRGAAEGAAVGGAVGAVSGIFNGGIGKAAEHAAKGAVVGGTAGAVHGAFRNDKPNPMYRNFVGRCLKDQGLEVIGWN